MSLSLYPLAKALSAARVSDRLYRISVEKYHPSGCASNWEVHGFLYDVHDRSIEEIAKEIDCILDGRGRWRVTVYYWSGNLEQVEPRRFMGRGENFLYSPNPRGELIMRLDPPIEIDFSAKS